MAEMQSQDGNHRKRGGRRSKKLSTRVDLTPMVDLGFLLITFFIFTTTMSEAKVMKMNLPEDKVVTDPNTVSKNKVLTVIPAAMDKVFYYSGDDPATMQVTNFAPEGIRKVITSKKSEVASKYGNAQDLVILIKPTKESCYRNLVDMLDEMLINNVTRYMLLDVEEKEKQLVRQ
jgi:biopolymer transport protein ExbD